MTGPPDLQRLYNLAPAAPPTNLEPRFNVCPTDPADAVIALDGKRELVTMRWGLVPGWWSKPLMELKMATFNARVETVAEKPVFREAFQRRRCLMPVSCYYEWQDTPSGKQPHYFTARDGLPILTIAGLWDRWRDSATGETLQSCAMIITNANDFVGEVHDRMPVLLQPADFDPWLSGAAGLELLKPAANDLLQRWPVSRRVNSSRAPAEDPTLIESVELRQVS
jgi:putative SOS response-associated peptidase YedK